MMKIFVKILSTGKTISLDINPNVNIKQIKSNIADKESFTLHQQLLIFAGKKLENDKTLLDYQIKEQCTLMLVIRSSPNSKHIIEKDESLTNDAAIQLIVKTLTGKTLTLNAEESDTVKTIKIKIENIENIPMEQQRLIFSKKTLENDKLLSYYQIKTNSILHLVSKFKPLKSRENSIPNMCAVTENIKDNWSEYMRLLNNINWKNIPSSYNDIKYNDQNFCCDILQAIDMETNNTPSKIRNRNDFIKTLKKCEMFDLVRALNKTASNVYEAFKPFIENNLQIINVEMTNIEIHSETEEMVEQIDDDEGEMFLYQTRDSSSDSDSEYEQNKKQPNACCVGCTGCIIL
eukprot:47004_1